MLARIHAVVVWPLLFAWTVILLPFHASGAELKIAGQAAVLMEMRTGKILWRRNENLSLPPASTTKIITAVVVLERSKPGDFVKVTKEATQASGAIVRLQEGEELAVEQLLYGMLLRSANDAAVALAIHTGGSVAKFVGFMNHKARSLGALQSRFLNPTGLAQNGHVTTARDLAVLTRAALENSEFRKIVASESRPWKSAKWQGTLQSSNVLLDTYPGAFGVKTGHTKEAGFCLVVAAQRGGAAFLAVILNSTEKSRWRDAKILLDHGFNNFSAMSLIEPGKTILTSKVDGKNVTIAAAEPAHYVGPVTNQDPPRMQIALEELELPIAKGEKVGEAIFRDGDKELARVDLISRATVASPLPTTWVLGSASAVLLGLVVTGFLRHRRRHRYIFAGRGDRLKF